jgi:hypothetical protein
MAITTAILNSTIPLLTCNKSCSFHGTSCPRPSTALCNPCQDGRFILIIIDVVQPVPLHTRSVEGIFGVIAVGAAKIVIRSPDIVTRFTSKVVIVPVPLPRC